MRVNHLDLLISPEEIKKKVQVIAGQLNLDYQGEELAIIMVMKGAFCLVADLMRALQIPCSLDFVQASSYGQKGTQRGALTLSGIDSLDLKGKNVLIVDDIFDSGITLSTLAEAAQLKHPKTLRTLVLLSKNVPRTTHFSPDYALFEIENRFVVGYGLDYKEHYRGLPGVCIITPAEEN